MLLWLGRPGANPSATHPAGKEAARAVRTGREAVAALIGARRPSSIVFTSGGSESTSTAIHSAAVARPGRPFVRSTAEHSATRKAVLREVGETDDTLEIAIDSDGHLDRDALFAAIETAPALVTLILLNNETGVISDLSGVGDACRASGSLFHIDAVQAPGKTPIDVEELGCDTMSLSAHKFHGPRGMGALYVREGAPLTPLVVGGLQEGERRAGTENVPGIVGMGVAALRARALATSAEAQAELAGRRDRLEAAILQGCPGASVHGGNPRAANATNIGFELAETGLDATALLGLLHAQGIEVSAGSACNATRMAPSPVLRAMGLDAAAASSALRFSLAHSGTPDAATDEDIDLCAAAVVEAYGTLMNLVP